MTAPTTAPLMSAEEFSEKLRNARDLPTTAFGAEEARELRAAYRAALSEVERLNLLCNDVLKNNKALGAHVVTLRSEVERVTKERDALADKNATINAIIDATDELRRFVSQNPSNLKPLFDFLRSVGAVRGDAAIREDAGQPNNQTGERMYHLKDGLFFQRTANGGVLITKKNADGRSGYDIIVPASEWASVVAAVSARGENGQTHGDALDLHERSE